MSKKLAKIYHAEIFGKRGKKYDFLEKNDLATLQWQELKPKTPYYFFVPKDFGAEEKYGEGFKLDELFLRFVSGFQTKRDAIAIRFSETELEQIKGDIIELEEYTFRQKYKIAPDGRDWKLEWAKKDLLLNNPFAIRCTYRPFDDRFMYYTGKSKGFIAYPREKFVKDLVGRDNLTIITCRQQSSFDFQHIFCSRMISDMCSISSQTKETGYLFPLYLYHEDGTKTANFNQEIFEKIKANLSGEVKPEDVLDYIYASLHSPSYREKYKEFLKIDFPCVPYPKDDENFWQLVEKGRELRELHLLESSKLKDFITTFPESGSNAVEKIKYENGKVFINEKQHFGNVPEIAWNFYVGGYQPAQKWLKDRKGRTLGNEDLEHYQKIIVALAETDRLMKEIG